MREDVALDARGEYEGVGRVDEGGVYDGFVAVEAEEGGGEGDGEVAGFGVAGCEALRTSSRQLGGTANRERRSVDAPMRAGRSISSYKFCHLEYAIFSLLCSNSWISGTFHTYALKSSEPAE